MHVRKTNYGFFRVNYDNNMFTAALASDAAMP